MTKIATAFHIVFDPICAIDWRVVASRTANGLRLCWAVAQLLLMGAALLVDIAWQNRASIRQAAVVTIAVLVVAVEFARFAGSWTRQQIEALSQRGAELLPQQPLPAVAPISATMQAVHELLEQLVRRIYPLIVAA